jgi:hypothetical protein
VRSLLWREATSQSGRASGAPWATYTSGRVQGQRRVEDGRYRPSTLDSVRPALRSQLFQLSTFSRLGEEPLPSGCDSSPLTPHGHRQVEGGAKVVGLLAGPLRVSEGMSSAPTTAYFTQEPRRR